MSSGLIYWLGGGVAGAGTGLISYLFQGDHSDNVKLEPSSPSMVDASAAAGAGAGAGGPLSAIGFAGDLGGPLAWEIRRLFFWLFMLVIIGVVAFLTVPNEVSFRAYLTELSFRRHLRDLHGPVQGGGGGSSSSNSNSSTSVADERRTSQHTSDGYSTASDVESRTVASKKRSSHTRTSTSPTPFRFSNHVAISLRTPGYRFFSYHVFSIVCVLPAHNASGRSSHQATATAAARRPKPSSSLPTSAASSSASLHTKAAIAASAAVAPGGDVKANIEPDPTVAGIWFLGIFGQWWSMGALQLGLVAWPPIPFVIHLSRAGSWIFSGSHHGHGHGSGHVTIQRGRKGASLRKGGLSTDDGGNTPVGLLGVSVSEEETLPLPLDHSRVALDDHVTAATRAAIDRVPSPNSNTLSTSSAAGSQAYPRTAIPVIKTDEARPASTPPSPVRNPSFLQADVSTTAAEDSAQPVPVKNASSSSTLPDSSTIAASPALAELHASLLAAQHSAQDLRAQVASIESASANSHLRTTLDDLRKHKKEEDAERAELKARMRSLEENKRQAEGVRREAEKKLRSVEGERDGLRNKVNGMKADIERLKDDIVRGEQVLEDSSKHREQHTKQTREQVAAKREELGRVDGEIAQGAQLHAELTVQVLQAVEALQALIDQSPPNPSPEEEDIDDDFVVKRRPSSYPIAPESNGLQPYVEPYYPSANGPNYATDFRPFSPTRQQPLSTSDQYRETGFEAGFGHLGVPVQARGSLDAGDEPGSPSGTMSSSFSVNLLPQGLFSSLEGDVTPVDGQTEMGDSSADELTHDDDEKDRNAERDEGRPSSQPPSGTQSPADSRTPPSFSQGPQHAQPLAVVEDPDKLRRIMDDLNDAGHHQNLHGASRRWFQPKPRSANDVTAAPTGSTLFGAPLTLTTSNESLRMPHSASALGGDNPFAPSAAEKRALKWGSIGKWGIGGPKTGGGAGARDSSEPGTATRSLFQHDGNATATAGVYRPYLHSPTNSARSSSADLTGARSAWDHAPVPGDISDRILSLGRKVSGRKANVNGNGSSSVSEDIWGGK